jgi:mannose-6-phosphate isomerase-like protein (cupin superfamily)
MTIPTRIKIFDLDRCETVKMPTGRGETIPLVDTTTGTTALDVHVNRLIPGGARGKLHRHTKADNVYYVRRGEGTLVADGETTIVKEGELVFIPAGVVHSLSNLSKDVFEIIEIYAPAGKDFDFELVP